MKSLIRYKNNSNISKFMKIRIDSDKTTTIKKDGHRVSISDIETQHYCKMILKVAYIYIKDNNFTIYLKPVLIDIREKIKEMTFKDSETESDLSSTESLSTSENKESNKKSEKVVSQEILNVINKSPLEEIKKELNESSKDNSSSSVLEINNVTNNNDYSESSEESLFTMNSEKCIETYGQNIKHIDIEISPSSSSSYSEEINSSDINKYENELLNA